MKQITNKTILKQETLEEFIKEELKEYDEIDFSTYEGFIKTGNI